jgi:hypothetical protein
MFQSQAGQIVQETLSQKIPTQKRAGGVAQGVVLDFKLPPHPKKKKKKKKSSVFSARVNSNSSSTTSKR